MIDFTNLENYTNTKKGLKAGIWFSLFLVALAIVNICISPISIFKMFFYWMIFDLLFRYTKYFFVLSGIYIDKFWNPELSVSKNENSGQNEEIQEEDNMEKTEDSAN